MSLFRRSAKKNKKNTTPFSNPTKPLPLTKAVLVDVDGVLSPNQYLTPENNPADYYHSASGWNGGHYVPQRLLTELQELPAPKFWLTTWLHDAENTFNMGWPMLIRRSDAPSWKLDSVEWFLTRNPNLTHVVVLDDESSTWDFTNLRQNFPNTTFFVPVLDGAKGLGPDTLEQVRDFLNRSDI